MKRCYIPVVICLLSCCLFACKKEALLPGQLGNLAGSWEWVRTDGGFANHIHETPVSTGKAIQLKFENNGTYQLYTNNSLTEQGHYEIVSAISIVDGSRKPVIYFDSGTQWMITQLDKKKMELSDNAADGIGSLYLRN